MEWQDEGLLLSVRRHGERSLLAEVMTREHGRHLGLIRSVSKGDRPLFQSGNQVSAIWKARLEQHLGNFQLEITKNRTPLMLENRTLLSLLGTLVPHLRLLPERDPHPKLLDEAEALLLAETSESGAMARLALLRFEYLLLSEMGFGLDWSRCALSGDREGLCWVSPVTGRAVTEAAGKPWVGKLMALPEGLPALLLTEDDRADSLAFSEENWSAAFALLAYFLNRNLYGVRNQALPSDRALFLRLTGT